MINIIYIHVDHLSWLSLESFENWTIIKDFTMTFVNKDKMGRISYQTITKVPHNMVQFSKYKALHRA